MAFVYGEIVRSDGGYCLEVKFAKKSKKMKVIELIFPIPPNISTDDI